MRFISPKTDFAFKKIFGSTDSKPILISFERNSLPRRTRNPRFRIIDPYSAGTTRQLKDSYLDVKALFGQWN